MSTAKNKWVDKKKRAVLALYLIVDYRLLCQCNEITVALLRSAQGIVSLIICLLLMRLGAPRPGIRPPQKERRKSGKKPARDDDAFPDDSCSENLRGRCAKRREQHHQRRFANSDSTLRNRHDRRNFRQRPRKEPHPQRKAEPARNPQKTREQNIRALHGSPEQPASEQTVGTARDGAYRMTQLRESPAEANRAATQEWPAQYQHHRKKNDCGQKAGDQHAPRWRLQRSGQRSR